MFVGERRGAGDGRDSTGTGAVLDAPAGARRTAPRWCVRGPRQPDRTEARPRQRRAGVGHRQRVPFSPRRSTGRSAGQRTRARPCRSKWTRPRPAVRMRSKFIEVTMQKRGAAGEGPQAGRDAAHDRSDRAAVRKRRVPGSASCSAARGITDSVRGRIACSICAARQPQPESPFLSQHARAWRVSRRRRAVSFDFTAVRPVSHPGAGHRLLLLLRADHQAGLRGASRPCAGPSALWPAAPDRVGSWATLRTRSCGSCRARCRR